MNIAKTPNNGYKSYDFIGNTVVVLHISIRPDQRAVVLSSKSGSWMHETRLGFPIRIGELFELKIYAHENSFSISFNGVHFHDFKFQLPLSKGHYVAIYGKDLRADEWEVNVEG